MNARSMQRLHIIVGLCLLAMSCARARHQAIVVDTALYQTLAAVHETEQRMLCGLPSCATSAIVEHVDGWTAAKSQAFNRRLLPAVEAGRQFDRILAAWDPRDPPPAILHQLIPALAQAVASVLEDMPESPSRTAILAQLAQAQRIVLVALDLILAGRPS